MAESSGYSLTTTIETPPGNPHKPFVHEILQGIEGLAERLGAPEPFTSAADDEKGGWSEWSVFDLPTRPEIDRAAEEIVRLVRRAGIPPGCSVVMEWSEAEQDVVERHSRRVYPKRDTRWRLVDDYRPEAEPRITLPKRIRYLATLARKYYGIGGGEAAVVFRERISATDCLAQLKPSERKSLTSAYRRIAADDLDWIVEWLQTGEEPDMWSDRQERVFYLMCVLDALNEVGLSGEEVEPLVDWMKFQSG